MTEHKKTGDFIKQAEGYSAFVPNPLSNEQPIEYDSEFLSLHSAAERALVRLDGIATTLPNPDLFIAMYVKKEALLSSQIEGTQASLEGVLELEAEVPTSDDVYEVSEVVNYINAMNYGITRLAEFPMSLRLIREIHGILLEGTRGTSRNPGEFRNSQNWIGQAGRPLNEAVFVPPPPHEVLPAMGALEKFMHEESELLPLVKIAMIHAQFETIHPFLDGNGRIGRLLITFYLLWKRILSQPLLYLSFYLKKHRSRYYELLMNIRTQGDWRSWLVFFLRGVEEISQDATDSVREILTLREAMIQKLYEASITSMNAMKLLDVLFRNPLITSKMVSKELVVSAQTANSLLNSFHRLGVLSEITGKKRYKVYFFHELMHIIIRGTENIA